MFSLLLLKIYLMENY